MGFKMGRSGSNVSVICLAFVFMLSVNSSAADILCSGPTLEQPGKEQCELVEMTNLTDRHSLVFHAKGAAYVVLGLSDKPDPEAGARMVWIGRRRNWHSTLASYTVCGKTSATSKTVSHPDALNTTEFRTFWLKWDDHNMTFGSGSTVGDSEVISHSFPTAMPIRALFLFGVTGYPYKIYFDDPDGDSCNKEMPTTTDGTTMTEENMNNSSNKMTQETTEAATVNTVNTNNVSKTIESSVTTSSTHLDISCRGPTLEQPGQQQCELVEMTNMSARNSLVFHAKGAGYVVLGLSDKPDPEAEARMVWIGRYTNTGTLLSHFNVCGKTGYGYTQKNVPHPNALNPEEFRTFWLKWDDNNMTFGSGSTVGDSEMVSHNFPTAMPIRALFLSGHTGYPYQIYFDDPDGDSCNKEMPTTTDKITQETTEAATVNTVNTNNVSKTMESSETTSSNVQNSSKRAESAEKNTESTTSSEKYQEEFQESSRMTTEPAAVNTESSSLKKDLDAASTKSTAKSVESQGVTLGTTSESTAEPIEITTESTTKATNTTKINTAPNVSVAIQTTSNAIMAEATDTYITPTVKNNIDDQTKTMASSVTPIKAGVEDVDYIEDSGLSTATDVGHLATETATNTEAANNKWDSDLATATINAESNTETQKKLAETHKTYAPPANKPLKFSRAQKGCNCILRRPSTKNNENGTSPLDEEDKKKQEALSTAVKKELAVERKELSASVRKKVSTADKRPTTAVVGYVLAGVCFAPLGLIVLADIVNVFRYVYNAVKDKAY